MWPGERPGRSRARGFTYVGLLALIVLIGLMLAAAGEVASTTAQRERETELLFIGHQYRDAIGRFVAQNHRYPQTLEELVESKTGGPVPAHYLRRLYPDPITRAADWTLVPAPGNGIMGIASASTGVPLKHAEFESVDLGFADAETYHDWVFRFDPRRRPWPGVAAAPGSVLPR